MKRIIWFSLSLLLILSPRVGEAFNCDDSCDDQCRKGFLGNIVDPGCVVGCRVYMVKECFKMEEPFIIHAMGITGAQAYPAAADIMTERNPRDTSLDEIERSFLQTFFGNLVNKVRIHWSAQLMDRWGSPPYEIVFFNSVGQTYGYDIYLAPSKSDLSLIERLVLIGHEMEHTRQFVNSGESLARFGKAYFESFAEDGGYYNVKFEKEAFATDQRIAKAAQKFVKESAPWRFEVCNHSTVPTIFVATAKARPGFTLVDETDSKGWYRIEKGKCETLVNDNRGEEEFFAYATSNTQGNGLEWARAHRFFCIDRTNRFDLPHTTRTDFTACDGQPDRGLAAFQSIPNPWVTDNKGVYTWDLSGSETELMMCNRSGEKVIAATLQFERQEWKSLGWFSFENQECKPWKFGGYTGPIYIYGENVGRTKLYQSTNQPKFCVERPNAFKHLASLPCRSGEFVQGQVIQLVPGINNSEFR